MIDFIDYIHGLREEVINKIKKFIKADNIRAGLEVGAGDGYQSRLLVSFLDHLTVTEFSEDRLKQLNNEKIEYHICDAENLEATFNNKKFDLIFSSHLLEHLPESYKLLQFCKSNIEKHGYIIHVVPSSWYAIFRLLFWYPSLVQRFLKKFINSGYKWKKFAPLEKRFVSDNNIKLNKRSRSKIVELLVPIPHGVYGSVIKELFALRKKSWMRLFSNNELYIQEIIKGSCFSGYGFGLKRIKKILTNLGVTCEYIFILRNKYD